MAQMLALVSLPFLLDGMGYDAVAIGLMIPADCNRDRWPPVSGHLSDRYPAGLLGGIGLGIFAIGLLSLALLPPHAGVGDIVAHGCLRRGLWHVPVAQQLRHDECCARSHAVVLGGMLATARLLGQTSGASIVAMMFIHVPGQGAMVALFIALVAAIVAAFVSLARL